MDINATIDVGDNVTGMLEKLAGQLGTTADKVFPWYVQQAHLEGVTALVAMTVSWIVVTTIFIVAVRRVDWEKGNGWAPVAFLSGASLFATLLFTIFDGTDSVRKVMNPNYYAMKMLTQDVGRLVRK